MLSHHASYEPEVRQKDNMMRRFNRFLALLLQHAALAMDADCPCISVNLSVSTGRGEQENSSCLPYRYEKGISPQSYCYPLDYGSSNCKAWDAGLEPFCSGSSDLPLFCPLRWCYVDREACKSSTKTFVISHMFPHLDNAIYFSYSTCACDPNPAIHLSSR